MNKFKPTPKGEQKPDSGRASEKPSRATRETVESIAIAVILAFLFRAFVAEAFVIPTGSMAPTLQGRHMDVQCEQCQFRYRAGASVENDGQAEVLATTCPICRFTMALDKRNDANQRSFNGDRILVSKFAYEVGKPQRWDVIVFKYPGNAKQNYIKRLVGLPNEELQIRHGDIYRKPLEQGGSGDSSFQIVRKPPHKVLAMAQLVDDTHFRAPALAEAGWPERWQQWDAVGAGDPIWQQAADGRGFEMTQPADAEAWLRYRHIVPTFADWSDLENGEAPARLKNGEVNGQLITDFYEYNASIQDNELRYPVDIGDPVSWKPNGVHWVGDLMVEADLTLEGNAGELLLELREGGTRYQCRIDVGTGTATLNIDQGSREFTAADGRSVAHPKAKTRVAKSGRYSIRFANCDDRLILWVNGSRVDFDSATTFDPGDDVRPRWSPEDSGDLEPVGIGARGVKLSVSRLKVFRDVYYVAVRSSTRADNDYEYDYQASMNGSSMRRDVDYIRQILASPDQWNTSPLFGSRRAVTFELGESQYFPLGDNSPQSRDGRLWSNNHGFGELDPPPYVHKDLLTGKALLIYWPHAWREPIPLLPNFERMGLIR